VYYFRRAKIINFRMAKENELLGRIQEKTGETKEKIKEFIDELSNPERS